MNYGHWICNTTMPTDAVAFVYKVTTYNKEEGFKYYVGYKSINGGSKWTTYTTSSKVINRIIKANTHTVSFEIMEWFNTRDDAVKQERNVQQAYTILTNNRWHNKCIASDKHFITLTGNHSPVGERSGMFKGYWVTPNGTFASSLQAGKANNVSHNTIMQKCYTRYPGYMFVYANDEAKQNETSKLAQLPKYTPPQPKVKVPRVKPPKVHKPRAKETKPRKKYKTRKPKAFVYDGVVYDSKAMFMSKVQQDHPTINATKMMKLRKRGIPYSEWSTWLPTACTPKDATPEQLAEIRRKIFHL